MVFGTGAQFIYKHYIANCYYIKALTFPQMRGNFPFWGFHGGNSPFCRFFPLVFPFSIFHPTQKKCNFFHIHSHYSGNFLLKTQTERFLKTFSVYNVIKNKFVINTFESNKNKCSVYKS